MSLIIPRLTAVLTWVCPPILLTQMAGHEPLAQALGKGMAGRQAAGAPAPAATVHTAGRAALSPCMKQHLVPSAECGYVVA